MYDAVIFDNDGVLTGPTDREVLKESIRETFREFGVADPPERHVEELLGVTVEDVRSVCSTHGIDAEEFWPRRDHNASRVQREEIRRGRKSLYDDVDAVVELPCELGIVSNNQHRTIEYIVDFFGLEGRFGTYYGRDPTVAGIRRKKPDPHYLRRAIEDLDADDVLYVGDSNVDLAAADAIGVDSAFLWRSHRREYDLEREPTHEIDSLADLRDVVG